MTTLTPPPPPGTYPRPASGGRGSRPLVPVILGVIVLVIAISLLTHHENRYERLAADVTRALAANDMRPVEKEFNAIRRAELEDRGKVGRLSDFVNAEGKFKGVKEDTPAGSVSGYHHFVASFENGTRAEDLKVDADGKIVDFHVKPSAP